MKTITLNIVVFWDYDYDYIRGEKTTTEWVGWFPPRRVEVKTVITERGPEYLVNGENNVKVNPDFISSMSKSYDVRERKDGERATLITTPVKEFHVYETVEEIEKMIEELESD